MVQHAQVSEQQEPGLFCIEEYYMHIIPAHRNWGSFSISFWSIPWDENSLYHRHTYFEYNHLVTKQLAIAYRTKKSWEWEVLFLLLVSAENYTSAEWNAVYYHTGWSSTSPADCNFTGWWAQRETPPHTCLAVLSCWPGGCWLCPGCGRDHLGRDKDQCLARLSGENANKHSWGWVKSVLSRALRALSCPFHAGRMPSESITWRLETNRGRFKNKCFFHKKLFIHKATGKNSSCPMLPVRVLHKCFESCTDTLHIFSNCSKVVLPPWNAVMCSSPTCHDRNKPLSSSPWTIFFFFLNGVTLLENPDSIPLHQLLFCEKEYTEDWLVCSR